MATTYGSDRGTRPHRVHRPMAKVLAKELEPFKLMFIEEPVLSEHSEALKEIANHSSTPIALGERLFSRWDFKRILEGGYVDNVFGEDMLLVAFTTIYGSISVVRNRETRRAALPSSGPVDVETSSL